MVRRMPGIDLHFHRLLKFNDVVRARDFAFDADLVLNRIDAFEGEGQINQLSVPAMCWRIGHQQHVLLWPPLIKNSLDFRIFRTRAGEQSAYIIREIIGAGQALATNAWLVTRYMSVPGSHSTGASAIACAYMACGYACSSGSKKLKLLKSIRLTIRFTVMIHHQPGIRRLW